MDLAAVADVDQLQRLGGGEQLGGADGEAGAAQQPAEGEQVAGQRLPPGADPAAGTCATGPPGAAAGGLAGPGTLRSAGSGMPVPGTVSGRLLTCGSPLAPAGVCTN